MPRLKPQFDRLSHLFFPLSVLAVLLIINLIKGADYFKITLINGVFYGNIPNILFGASELVILSIGMTLVTAAARGQDISIGESGAISSAIFVQYVLSCRRGHHLDYPCGFPYQLCGRAGNRRLQRHPGFLLQCSANGGDPHPLFGGQVDRVYY